MRAAVPRLVTEDLRGLGYEPRPYAWYEDKIVPDRKLAILRELAGGAPLGTDVPYADLKPIGGAIAAARAELTPGEAARYRVLGRETAEAVVAVVEAIRPGMSEREIEAMTSDALMKRGIRPTVLLIGADHRIYDYRHVPPSDARVERYAMVNVCARRGGLVAAVTRFVHFGPPPPELTKRLAAAAKVNAALQARTRAGVSAADLLTTAKRAYLAAGFPAEWEQHHQGGAIGYGERDWVAYPGAKEVVRARQAFAWNPTVKGAKTEDTVLLDGGRIENLTLTRGWPTIATKIGGRVYMSPGILVRPAAGVAPAPAPAPDAR